ncbi:Protein yippee-like [Cardamine amara subsp. amara]|uniref:Protein yippee-like n=1 Tax=Cardamine amara subsp. amara TaxID=228776 RepID=A0ABD1AR16_CARAN
MGRLFMIDLEGSTYKCKHCKVEFVVYEDLPIKRHPFIEYPDSLGKLYFFMKCDNVVIENATVTLTINGKINNTMSPVFCIGCGSHVGFYYGGADDTVKYNEGNFYINRLKLLGPPEGSDNENQ